MTNELKRDATSERKAMIDPVPWSVRSEPDHFLEHIKRGDLVVLLLPMWDGTQYFNAGETIRWPFDSPPLSRAAIEAGTPVATPDNVPAMGNGRPPDGYLDPRTGEPLPEPDYRY